MTTTIVRVMFSLANVYFLTVSSSVKVRVSDIEEVHPLEIPGSTGKKKAYCVFYGRLTGVFYHGASFHLTHCSHNGLTA